MTDNTAEPYLVSIAVQSAEATTLIQSCVDLSDFEDPFHQQVMTMLYERPKHLIWDSGALCEALGITRGTGLWDRFNNLCSGSMAAGGGYFNFKLNSTDELIVDDLCRVVIERSKRRFIARGGEELARIAKEPYVDIKLLEAEIEDLQRKLTSGSDRKTFKEKTLAWLDRLSEKYDARNDKQALGTGMPTIDALIVKFAPGELIIVAARRKVGKSALMVGVVDKSTVQGKAPGLVISLEMGVGEWLDRLIAHRSGVDSQRLGTGKLTESDFSKITGQMNAIQAAPLHIEDEDCFTAGQITSLIRYHKFKHDIAYAMIDHAQLVAFPKSKDRTQDLDNLGATLKNLAKKLGIPIFLLSQTNDRGVTFGSAMLEAHLTKLIRIEIPEDQGDHSNQRFVNLLLNRSGRTGGVLAIFDGATCRFRETTL